MYRSTQFLSYNVLHEDTRRRQYGNPRAPILDVVGAVYQITEIVDFCHRLASNGLYSSGAKLEISLLNTEGRLLRAGSNRMPFFDRKAVSIAEISVRRDLDVTQLRDDYRSIAIGVCIELFDHFGWKPVAGQLEAEQDGFYRQEWR